MPLLLLLPCSVAHADIALIAHASIAKVDEDTVQKIFTGRVIEVGGVNVVPVNAGSGSALRNRFLKAFLNQDEEKYTAYWTVRRYIGKGKPPRELAGSSADIIAFVQATPGAVGYVEEADLKTGVNVVNVLLRK
ncbi:MAG: hypothetical protein IPH35_20055 [Rhodoferax sp.]|nr:hypothetical protein [Rhodoferax sp.]